MPADEQGAKNLLERIREERRGRAGRARAGSRSRRGRPQALLSAAPRRALRLAGRGRTARRDRPGARLDASRERLRRRERRAVAGGPRDERARVSGRQPRGEGRGRDARRRARRFVRLRQRGEAGRAGHEAPRGPPRPVVRGDQSRRARLRDGSGSPDAPPMGPSPFARHRPRRFLLERRDGERERRDVQHAEAPFRPRGGLSVARASAGRRPAVRPPRASTRPSGRAPISGRSSAARSGRPRTGSNRRRGP